MEPGLVFFVKLIQIVNSDSLFLGSAAFGHSRGANFRIRPQVDESVQLELAQRVEQVRRPLLVNCPLSLRHQPSFEAVSRENVPEIGQEKPFYDLWRQKLLDDVIMSEKESVLTSHILAAVNRALIDWAANWSWFETTLFFNVESGHEGKWLKSIGPAFRVRVKFIEKGLRAVFWLKIWWLG